MVYIGRIMRAHGTRGRVLVGELAKKVQSLPKGTEVHIGYSASFTASYTVRYCKAANASMLLQLEHIDTPEDVAPLREKGVFVPEEVLRAAVKTPVYLDSDIVGCAVYNVENGLRIGEIIDVWELPANDVWLMRHESLEIPLPVIDDVIKNVDIGERRVDVYLMPGLMELG